MPRNVIRGAARRVYARMPGRLKSSLTGMLVSRSYAGSTAGLTADASAVDWVARNGRPVSIVIPSYNDVPLLSAALDSVASTCAGMDYEVIVVDDYCQPENTAALRALMGGRVRLVEKERREGFAVTVNRGMAEARHDIVLLNSDVVAQQGWLHSLQRSAYAVDPAIGLVSPKLVYPDGRIQYGGTYYARLLAPQWFGHLFVGSPATRSVANVPGYNRSISGACVYIRRDVYDRLGGLDEAYWLGFEDVDYGLAAWAAGFRCYYDPSAMLIHHESATRGYSQGMRELGSMRYFWRRWGSMFLERTVAQEATIDLVVSSASTAMWRHYVEQLAAGFAARGRDVAVHVAAGERDEDLVGRLAARDGLKIACDWGASVTVWLGSLEAGKPVYLLPGVESGRYPADPDLQSRIVAQYRPEFDYIAPNRWTADQLRAEAAWESQARVVPALAVVDGERAEPRAGAGVVTIGLDPSARVLVERLSGGTRTEHLDAGALTPEVLDRLRADPPRVVVNAEEFPTSLEQLAVMGTGAALVTTANDRTRYEVLDGYNALVAAPGSEAFETAITALLGDPALRSEVASNGVATSSRYASLSADATIIALSSISSVSV